MESGSVQTSPVLSPSLKSVKKAVSNQSHASSRDLNSEVSSLRGPAFSAHPTSEKSPSRISQDSSRDGSSRSGSSGIRKLIPGHEKRKRRRRRENEMAKALEQVEDSRVNSMTLRPDHNQSTASLSQGSSLLTDDSEPEAPPPLISRDSHLGYLTSSSPLVTTSTDDSPVEVRSREHNLASSTSAVHTIPIITEAPTDAYSTAIPVSESSPALNPHPLSDRVDTLKLPSTDRPGRRKSISSSIRGISPARRLKDKLMPSKSDRSPKTSPERDSGGSPTRGVGQSLGGSGSINERRQAANPDHPPPIPSEINTHHTEPSNVLVKPLPFLETERPPRTPPSATPITPLTTVTPPTPTDSSTITPTASPSRNNESISFHNDNSGVVVSPSGNMISHRRTRSQPSNPLLPSKLSNSIFAPLTPTIEETKTPPAKAESRSATPGGGFFSSWVSAAQNAATSLSSSLNVQNRSRSGTTNSEPEKPSTVEEKAENKADDPGLENPKKQLAVETLGMGDLSFSHLGIEVNGTSEEKQQASLRPDLEELRKDSIRRDEAAAKIEDMLAKRAVSAAYQKDPGTPVAEVGDPMNSMKHAGAMSSAFSVDQSTPNGSILEGEVGSVKRNNSVRSRIQERRSRGSSTATGTSTIAAIVGASTATLANPATGPRLTGFTVAPKNRNRAFHQLFRSVPDDDYLIEDYSCALQRDILLAGRIYISEGHICFSSNILGWVTTLVISFEEVVSFEKETTAMVFPNAIAIQTLHARHTFRSLLSREATFDLLIGIWKVSHPAAFQKSINGKQMEQEANEAVEKAGESDGESEVDSEEEDEVYDEDDDEETARSIGDRNGSVAGSETADSKSVIRGVPGANGTLTLSAAALNGESQPGEKSVTPGGESAIDFPGPATHAPTECSDSATHYEKIVKDEIIPAPLGKIFSLLYGPASGAFVGKFLTEECKVTDLMFEDDKKGLTNEIKSRQYTYIKPLGGSIGPKQTKCITTENLDSFDLDKAVSVTCTTQTPDVPSGNAFSVKTRYCLSWAPGNGTRFQMNCGIEWTAKSWLKGPIEKGANDGQLTYGNDLVKSLRAAVSRPRGATSSSKTLKTGKKRRKSEKHATPTASIESQKRDENWGIFEILRGPLGPVVSIFSPMANGPVAVGIIVLLLFMLWLRSPSQPSASSIGFAGMPSAHRIVAYQEMWQREESDLWNWLEERVGVDGLVLGDISQKGNVKSRNQDPKVKLRQRQKILGGKDVVAKLNEEKMSEREMDEAIRVTQERLQILKEVVEKRKSKRGVGD